MKNDLVILMVFWIIMIATMSLMVMKTHDDSTIVDAAVEQPMEVIEEPKVEPVIFTDLGVPTNVDTSFKTYMDWRTITNRASNQYKLINTYGWHDEQGFMRVRSERDLGITDDYYMIALGSYYGTEIGTKYRITTTEGRVFYGILSDCKDDRHTNSTHQYARNKDVVEFLVDTRYLNSAVMRMGSANIYSPLRGAIAKIERIDFK